MKKQLLSLGHALCLLAVITASGGHWFALQSIAWANMVLAYSKEGSFKDAIIRTFDGQHPCKMCVAIRDGRQQEDQQHKQTQGLWTEKMPDLILETRISPLPLAFSDWEKALPLVPRWHSDFIGSPLTPPPRFSLATS